jgi:hypothetical protein
VIAQVNANTGAGWMVFLAAPRGQPLVAGTYLGAMRSDFRTGTAPGIDVFGDGRGCSVMTGHFVIYSIEFFGSLTHIDATFEQHCEGGTPALKGAVKI